MVVYWLVRFDLEFIDLTYRLSIRFVDVLNYYSISKILSYQVSCVKIVIGSLWFSHKDLTRTKKKLKVT